MSDAIKKALGNLEEIVPAGADGSYYQGQELAEKKCQEVAALELIHYISCMQC